MEKKNKLNEPEVLNVKPGDTVLVGVARDPDAPTLFQVANIDLGGIK